MTMVILVDKYDRAVGTMPKMESHEKGILHRAFSVLIFNSKRELLLQRRAYDKYHSGGLWANTCCSHPVPGEDTVSAAQRRLKEELGMRAELIYIKSFIYQADLDHGLQEHELDHIFIGYSDELPIPNREEVAEYRYATLAKIREDMYHAPDHYAEWFKIIVKEFDENLIKKGI